MLAFGQAAFMVVPPYTAGVLERAGLGPAWALVVGLGVGIVIARLLAELFVRLPGIYLAFGTLGFGFVVEGLARAFPAWTGGASGLVLTVGRQFDPMAWYVASLAALAVGIGLYSVMLRGALWRRLRTIRHDELVAAAVGIDVRRAKAQIFTIGCLYACIAGTLLCYFVGVVVPEDAGAQRSLSQIGMLMIGGPASAFGPVIGAFLVSWLFFVAGYGAQLQSLIYGVVFLLAVLYAKNGLLGFLPTDAAARARRPATLVSDLGAAAVCQATARQKAVRPVSHRREREQAFPGPDGARGRELLGRSRRRPSRWSAPTAPANRRSSISFPVSSSRAKAASNSPAGTSGRCRSIAAPRSSGGPFKWRASFPN